MRPTSLCRSTGFQILALASLYLLVGWAIRAVAWPYGFGTLVWLPAGLALAAVMVLGYRVWPGVALGSFLTNYFLNLGPSSSAWTSVGIALGATLQALVGTWLVNRFRGVSRNLDTPREIRSLVLLGAAASCLVSATVATLLLWRHAEMPVGEVPATWFSWWMGDAVGVLILTPPLLLLDPKLPDGRRRLLRVAWPVALAFALVLAISAHIRHLEDQAIWQDFRNDSAAGLRVLDWEFRSSLEILDSVERLVVSSDEVTGQEFHRFVAPFLEGHPALETLGLAALVPESHRQAFEARWFPITELGPEGRLTPAAHRAWYAPLQFIEPLQGNDTFLGLDLASETLRGRAIQQSLSTTGTVATAPLRLLLGKRGARGYAVFKPIRRNGQVPFLALAGFDLGRLFGPPLDRAGLSWMGVQVYDLGPAGEGRILVFDRPAERDGPFRQILRFQRATRHWEVVFSGAPQDGVLPAGGWGVLAGGTLFTGILGVFMLLVTGQASRTEQMVVERTAEVQRLARRTQLILDSADEGICGIDLQGVANFVNPGAARLAGYRAADMLDRDLHALLHPAGLCPGEMCPILACLGDGRVHSDSGHTFQRLDGGTFPVDCVAAPIREEGALLGAVVLFRDISERLAADRMKSEFVSVVSHELRTPLTAIRGSLGLVSSGKMGALPPAVEKMVAMAMRNVDRLALLIDDILSLEAMESGTVCLEVQDCPARDLLQRALDDNRPLAERASIPLELGRAGGTVRADPHRIQQVLTNLVGNAVKFSPPGAPIVLAAIPVEADREVRFEVRDHGRGIPADQVQHVFERFRQVDSSDTREKGGTGLGLAICRNLVRAHNGRIWVESVEGRGSAFMFTLPMADAQEQG